MEKGMRVLLGVSGGIAAYKIPALVRELVKAHHEVHVVLTRHARKFVSPLVLEALSGFPVLTSLFDLHGSTLPHIEEPLHADLMVIAPATANILGKIAHGIADDLLSTMVLALDAPLLMAPAMNTRMYHHPAVAANIEVLRKRGVHLLEPAEGELACGESGPGRMPEVAEILRAIEQWGRPSGPLRGKRVLVTAGPTLEPIDPVRVLTNRSSGKMGYAVAVEALRQGADVTLISGPTRLSPPEGVGFVAVETAREMQAETENIFPQCDVLIMTAAVGDYRLKSPAKEKMKKGGAPVTLPLVENPDILKTVAERKRPDQFLVGFAAETGNLKENARRKLTAKGVDLLVANDVTEKGAGFGSDENRALILDRSGTIEETGLLPKSELARRILARIAEKAFP